MDVVRIRRAVNLLFLGRAEFMEAHDPDSPSYSLGEWLELSAESHEVIQAGMYRLRVPSVVMLPRHSGCVRREVGFSRANVYLRDGYRCVYCERKHFASELSLDHVVPRALGGRTDWSNIVTACRRCNALKSDRYPSEAGLRLRRAPVRPTWREFIAAGMTDEERVMWEPFWFPGTKKPSVLPTVSNGTGSQDRTDVICVEGRGPTAERYPQTV